MGGIGHERVTREKTPFFEVFRKVLIDKWLHGYLSVNGRFTKSEIARGKVLVRER